MSDLIERLIRPEILDLASYHVQDNPCKVKLDAMENPHTLPSELVDKWLKILQSAPLNLYPDPKATVLSASLKKAMQVPESMDILLGNGSDELIQIILMSLAKPGAKVLSLDPSFVMFEMIAKFVGMKYIKVPLGQDFSLPTADILRIIAEQQPAVIFIANPNNPTGNLFERQAIENVIQAASGLVVVDEAYFSFTSERFMQDLLKYSDNLLVMRTVSKLGLAGLRLGMLAGNTKWIEQFNKVRLPYNINILTQLSVTFMLENKLVLDEQSAQIVQDRKSLFTNLEKLEGVKPYPSEANFILFKVLNKTADRIHTGLIKQGVLIKNMNSVRCLELKDCLRVSVGTKSENDIFLAALRAELEV